MQNTHITSDTYFGRKSIIKKRGFDSIEEMNNTMIKSWNETVEPDDTVYHLGNFAWDPFHANLVLQQLNGHIIFLKGNHDKALHEAVAVKRSVELHECGILEIPNLGIVLSHYPMLDWRGKEKGTINFHGHDYKKYKTDIQENRVNICSDLWQLKPAAVESVKDILKEFKELT
jgi:calcineurin-like phosphoesterase family protein